MRNAHIAEWILSLFTTRERAGATVGDLTENASAQGALWFWSGILRTAFSLFWADFAAEPGFLAGLSFRALLLNVSLHLLAFTGVLIVSIIITGALILTGASALLSAVTLNPSSPLLWLVWIPGLLVEFQTGRWIARRARGREIAGCFAFLIVQTVVMQVVGEAVFGGSFGAYIQKHASGIPQPEITWISILFTNLVGLIAMFSGAIRVRRRSSAEAEL